MPQTPLGNEASSRPGPEKQNLCWNWSPFQTAIKAKRGEYETGITYDTAGVKKTLYAVL